MFTVPKYDTYERQVAYFGLIHIQIHTDVFRKCLVRTYMRTGTQENFLRISLYHLYLYSRQG